MSGFESLVNVLECNFSVGDFFEKFLFWFGM